MKPTLVIGGPKDGEFVETDAHGFRAPIQTPVRVDIFGIEERLPRIEYTEYQRITIRCEVRFHDVFAPIGMTADVVVDRLFDVYHQAATDKRLAKND